MPVLVCSRCGAQLLPNDQGVCPICRVPVFGGDAFGPDVLASSIVTIGETDAADVPLEPVFSDEQESLYSQTTRILRQPEPSAGGGALWLVASLVLFVLAGRGKQAPLEAAIVAGVIFFHELGHWLGMKMFGYRDLKIFFIPFFGGAAAGKKEGVPQWQQAIVVLLGPLPGIVLGFALLVANLVLRNATVGSVAWWLVLVNGFNLLPLVPLDGGRFLNIVIFSRQRVLEALFLATASIAVIALGVWGQAYVLAGLGGIGLLMVPNRFRVAGFAAQTRRRWSALPARIIDAADTVLRDLFQTCVPLPKGKLQSQPLGIATLMRQVYEQAVVRPVGLLASIALIFVYLGGIALTFAGVVLIALAAMAPPQQVGN